MPSSYTRVKIFHEICQPGAFTSVARHLSCLCYEGRDVTSSQGRCAWLASARAIWPSGHYQCAGWACAAPSLRSRPGRMERRREKGSLLTTPSASLFEPTSS